MSSNDFDSFLNVLDQLEKEEGRFGNQVLLDRSTLQVHLRFVRMMIRWEKSYRTGSWLRAVETEVTNAFYQILQPYKSRDYDQMHVTVGSLLKGISMYQKEITGFCRLYLRGYDYGLVCGDVNKEFVNPLVENMSELISRSCTCPLKEKLQELQRKLDFVRNCVASLAAYEGTLKPNWLEDSLSRMKMICQDTLFVCSLCWWDGEEEEEEKEEINFEILVADVLVLIQDNEPYLRRAYSLNQRAVGIDFQTLGAVDYLLADLEGWIQVRSSSAGATIQVAILVRELSFLRDFLMHPTELGRSHNLLTQITSLAKEVSTVVSCISELKISDKLYVVITELLKCLNTIKGEIRQCFIPESLSWHFPRTLNLGSLDFFLQNLEDLVRDRGNLMDYSMKHESETLLSELLILRSLLGKALEQPKKKNVERLKQIEERIVNMAYKAEFHIDFITVGSRHNWFHILSLYDVVDSIQVLKAEITQICENVNDPGRVGFSDSEEVVGFIDEAEKIIDRLQRGSKSLNIVSIVGMAGLGKTTLAQKLYKSRTMTSYFPIRSWCCISQVYTTRGLLLGILDGVIEVDDRKIQRMSDDDLADLLCKSLKGRRYLVVLDDIWGVDAWSDIRCCFPDQANGSRILLTSRSELVSREIKPDGALFNLRLFTKEESWQLLQKMLFGASSCPSELSIIGEKVAEYCRGLPLSVVVVAGILKDKDQTVHEWNVIAESVKKYSFDENKKVMGVLELSYQQLPGYLKPCFLYFGMFPEDKEISVQKLVSLWIAEGLVLKQKGINVEDVGEGYVKELVGRSLVMVAKRRSKGGIKACNIHDLLLQFCLEKAKEENFLLLSRGNEETFTSWNGSRPQSDYVLRDQPPRLCIHAGPEDLKFWRPYNYPHTRSLLFFTSVPAMSIGPKYENDFSFLVHCTKLLRVLDLAPLKIDRGFPQGVEYLVQLRYLAVRGMTFAVPESIQNLCNLDTLLVKGMQGEVSVPATIWKLRRLRHLRIRNLAAFKAPEDGNISGIESMATPSLCHGDVFTRDILAKLPRLRKLRCIFLDWWDVYEGGRQYRSPVLDCLSELESLKVAYHGSMRYDFGEFNLPHNLKKLTLSKFRLPWSVISQIGSLPNLAVLKLLFKSFEGDTWDVNDGEFPKLKFLKLDTLDIARWNASSDCFPCLEHLVVQRCKKLEGIPSEIGELDTLQKIEVQFSSRGAAESAQKIHEGQMDMGNTDLQVHIQE